MAGQLNKLLYRLGFVRYSEYRELLDRYLRLSAKYMAMRAEIDALIKEDKLDEASQSKY